MHSTKLYRPLSSVFIVANKRFGPVDKTGDKQGITVALNIF